MLVDHWVAAGPHCSASQYFGYLDPSNDIPLDPDTLPPGRLPLWIQRGVNVSDQKVLEIIKTEHVLDHETVTLVYSNFYLRNSQEIYKICQQNQWRIIDSHEIDGSEDEVVIIFDFDPLPEHITRAKKALILVTTIG